MNATPAKPLVCAGLSGMLAAGTALAGPLDLADAPLIATIGVKPNIMLVLDDSGSMDSEVLFPTNDGALWWHTADDSFVGRDGTDALVATGVLNFNRVGTADDTWKKYVYLFPNGTRTGGRIYADSTHNHFAIPPTGPFAFARSPAYNGMYYDPSETYTPWVDGGDYSFSSADPAAARSDPVRGTGTLNLAQAQESTSRNWTFKLRDGMVIPAGTHYRDWSDSTWKTAATDRLVTSTRDVPISYYPATYWLPVVSGGYTIAGADATVTGQCSDPDPAHYPVYAAAPGGFTAAEADALGPDGRCLRRYEITSGASFPSGRSYADELANFANWFSYYRKRHMALRSGAGRAFDGVRNARTGGFRINSRALQGMWDLETQRANLYNFLYTAVGSGGTPNRAALHYAGAQYNTNNAVITHRCQQNFTLHFTDGFSNVDTSSGVGNADGGLGEPYADGHSNTIADIAMRYYATALRPELEAGRVPVPSACNGANPPAWLDCNRNLHMVTYGITLGARGHIFGVTHDSIADAYADPPLWQDPTTTRNPVQVDDLYHAAINGRGDMLNASTATGLQAALSRALNNIAERTQGSSVSAATNTGFIGNDTKIFQARFNSADWTGQLLAFAIDGDRASATYGEVLVDGPGPEGSLWDAGSLVPEWNERVIFTSGGTGGRPFRWDAFTAAEQQAYFGADESLLDYLRGRPGAGRRSRAVVLGDIVNSAPVFVGAPAARYADDVSVPAQDRYSAFRTTWSERTPMIYVGANDGMLHGFDAETGIERMAYVPGHLLGGLRQLAEPTYSHRYFADGSPTVVDAFVGGSWRTVLVAGLNKGAQGVYALDVTDPSIFTETADNADTLALWELSDADDADLGYTYSQPAVVQLASGTWAAVFGNGYNSTEADGHASATGEAVLFVVNLATGSVIRKLGTGAGTAADPTGASRPNGLATVAAVDRDGDHVAETVYAGDLFGNLWKFDLASDDPAEWGVAYRLFSACAGSVCNAANRQPITTRPSVGHHASGVGVMVYFGTGKYIERTDNNGAAGGVQSFYGVWDRGRSGDGTAWSGVTCGAGPCISGRGALRVQRILAQGDYTFTDAANEDHTYSLRVTSSDAPDYEVAQDPNPDPSLGPDLGWYLDLVPPGGIGVGERQVTNSVLRNGRIIFSTVIPSADLCVPGGDSWLMDMDAWTGSRLTASPFDLDGDGRFTAGDKVIIRLNDQDVAVPVTGIELGGGAAATPTVLPAEDNREFKYISTTAGLESVEENPGDVDTGRQSWRELGR